MLGVRGAREMCVDMQHLCELMCMYVRVWRSFPSVRRAMRHAVSSSMDGVVAPDGARGRWQQAELGAWCGDVVAHSLQHRIEEFRQFGFSPTTVAMGFATALPHREAQSSPTSAARHEAREKR